MSLRAQMGAIVMGVTVAMLVFLFAVPYRLMVHEFADLERSQVLGDLGRAQGALDREAERLRASARDWAWWDETRDFVVGKRPGWDRANLTSESLAALQVSVLALCDLRGRMVGAAACDLATERAGPVPRELVRECLRARPGQGTQGLMVDGETVYVTATETVRGSDGTGTTVGTLVVARALDQPLQRDLARALRQTLMVTQLSPAEARVAGSAPTVRVLGLGTVEGDAVQADMLGTPAVGLRVTRPREVTARGREAAATFAATVVSAGLLFGLSLFALIETRVVSRVYALRRSIQRMASSGTPGQLPVGGRDELGQLAQSANAMLAALESSQAELRMIRMAVDQAGESVFLIDTEGCILYASDVACRELGYNPDELRGLPYGCLDPGLQPEAWPGLIAGLRSGGATTRASQYVGKDNRRRPVEASLAAAELGGQPLCVAVVRDITARQAEEYAQRLEAVGQLAAGVAHEFNNLLAGIVLSAEAVLRQTREAETRRLTATVMRAGHRGAGICRSLTAMARPRSEKSQPVRLEEALQAALDLGTPALREGSVSVTRDFRTGGRVVMADPGELEQVFLNLIINAAHAMHGGGELTIGVYWDPDPGPYGTLVARLTDTGCGIPEGNLPHIFEPFFTTKGRLAGSDVPGTGLGLSVSQGIITALDGTISVQTRPGHGTTFEVRIPVAADPMQTDDNRSWMSLAVTAETSGLQVLLAEDETDLGLVMAEGLEAGGHEVTCVADAREAMELLAQGNWDVVVSDLMMPGGGGRAVLAAALKTQNPPAVVVVTGRGDMEVQAEVVSAGAAACLQKPFSLGELLQVVQRAAMVG